MGEHLVLAHEGGGHVLGYHEAGVEAALGGEEGGQAVRKARVNESLHAALRDARELGEGDGEEVHGEGDGLAVEVAAGDDVAVFHDDGIVRDRVKLALDDAADVIDRVAAGAVDLGGASQGVGVLHALLSLPGREGRALEEPSERGRRVDLPRLSAKLVDARVEGVGDALEGLEAEGGRHLGGVDEGEGVGGREGPDGGHGLRAVDEGEPLLGREGHGLEAGRGEGLAPRHPAAAEGGFSRAHEDQGEVGERGQVARGAEGALLRHDRDDARVEHGHEGLDRGGPDPRTPDGEGVGAQEDHRAHDLLGEGIADSAGMAHDELALELAVVLP